MRTRLLLVALVLTAGCGVRPSGVITGGPAPSLPVDGTVLYFLADSSPTPVLRPAPRRLGPENVLALLAAGPVDTERTARLTSEVPAGLGAVKVVAGDDGVEVVASADVGTLSAAAVDQVVCTTQDSLATDAPVTLVSGTARRGPGTCPLPGPLSRPPR